LQEELDVLENEIDENDPLQNYVGELNGETLLAMCYSAPLKMLSQDTLNTDMILQNISSTNPHDFYDIGQKNHIHSKCSYSALRYVYRIYVMKLTVLLTYKELKMNFIQ